MHCISWNNFWFTWFNSLWPRDAIYGIARPQWVKPCDSQSGSPLAQVMGCCVTAPIYYPNQCLLTSLVNWHSSESNFTRDTSVIRLVMIYSETPHEQPPHEQPPLLWGHIFRHHYIFLTSHLKVNPWWTATPLTWSEASDFGSSHPWRAATQQLLEVASHGIHGWFGCGLTDIHVNHTSGQPWVHRPKACKGVDHT